MAQKPRSTTVLPPWTQNPERWVSTTVFASRWRRAPRTVRRWCEDGTVVSFGMRVFQESTRRWWIELPVDSSGS